MRTKHKAKNCSTLIKLFSYCGTEAHFGFVTERVQPLIKSTWVTGSVGVKESLVTRDPFKVTVGDDVRTFTKTKVRDSFFLNPWFE